MTLLVARRLDRFVTRHVHLRAVARPLLVAAALSCARSDAAPPPRAAGSFALGLAVDTVPVPAWGDFGWARPVPEITRRWREYLALRADTVTSADTAGARYWSAAERAASPQYDLLRARLGPTAATVLEVRPAGPAEPDVYVIKTLFSMPYSVPGHTAEQALGRVYATREHGRWVFSGALARETRDWVRDTVGPITYVVQPGLAFDRARAERARAFMDSVSGAFELPPVAKLTYFMARDADAINRITGCDWYVTNGPGTAGYAVYPNRQVFAADPSLGEEYRHELVHFVLAPLTNDDAHAMVVEGAATWLGGTLGMDPDSTRRAYAAYLARNPAVTLDSLLTSPYDVGVRPGGAVLFAMVHDRAGVAGVRALLADGTSEDSVRAVASRLLGRPWRDVASAWRARAASVAPAAR